MQTTTVRSFDYVSRGIAERRRSLSQSDCVVVVVVLVLLSGMLPSVVIDTLAGAPSVPKWPLYFCLYGLVGALALQRSAAVLDGLRPSMPIIGLSLLPLLSIIWSWNPGETLTQSLTLIGTTAVGVYLATAVPSHQALRLMAIMATITPLFDIASIALLPSVGIHQDGPWVGTWKGLHEQKNGLGAISAIALLVLLAYLRTLRWRAPWWLLVGLVAASLMLIASKSTTSWVTAVLAMVLTTAPRWSQRLLAQLVPTALVMIGFGLVAAPQVATGILEVLPGLIGKDSTMSNRLPIWSAVQPFMDASYWLGYGYVAFWTDAVLPRDMFAKAMYFVPSSAHSSYIELRLGLGVVGAAATAMVVLRYVTTLWRAHAVAVAGAPPDPILPLALSFFVFLAFLSVTESVILNRNDLLWVMFVWCGVHLGVLARPRRRSPAATTPQPAEI